MASQSWAFRNKATILAEERRDIELLQAAVQEVLEEDKEDS
jgi:hypothetical protein